MKKEKLKKIPFKTEDISLIDSAFSGIDKVLITSIQNLKNTIDNSDSTKLYGQTTFEDLKIQMIYLSEGNSVNNELWKILINTFFSKYTNSTTKDEFGIVLKLNSQQSHIIISILSLFKDIEKDEDKKIKIEKLISKIISNKNKGI